MQFPPNHDQFSAVPSNRSNPLVLLSFAVLMAAAVLPNMGCALSTSVRSYLAYNDTQNDFVMGFRNSVWARQAWAERQGCYEGQPYLGAFGAGFRAGYVSVASGGNGCPPPVPPRKYWTWKYQTPEGQGKVAAWFSGFPYGAQAAEEDQAGEYQNIQVSYAIEHQYSPEFQNSEFIEQADEIEDSLEAIPQPGFSPMGEVPLDESAHLRRGSMSMPPFAAQGQPVPQPGFAAAAVTYEQPIPSTVPPPPAQQMWPVQ